MNLKHLFIFLPLLFFLVPHLLSAQLDLSSIPDVRTSGTIFQLYPQVPGPNEKVTIRLENSDINLDTSVITWTINGRQVKSGLGAKTLSTETGNAGTQTTIRVQIQTDSQVLSDLITLNSNEIDLLWQGRGYVPPFYSGRNLWAKEGFITITAIPHIYSSVGQILASKNLVYRWKKDGEILGNSSGVGRYYLTFADSVLALPQTITLDVFDGDRIAASKTLQISSRNPKVLVYENNSLYGYMFNYEASGGFSLIKPEVTFASFPYYFSAKDRNDPALSFSWSSTKTSNFESANEVVFRVPENQTGSAFVKARVKNVNQILQGASSDFLIQFGNKNEF